MRESCPNPASSTARGRAASASVPPGGSLGLVQTELLATALCCYSRTLMSPAAGGSLVAPGCGSEPLSLQPAGAASPMASPVGSPLRAGHRRGGGLAPSPSSAMKDLSVEQQLTGAHMCPSRPLGNPLLHPQTPSVSPVQLRCRTYSSPGACKQILGGLKALGWTKKTPCRRQTCG